MRIRTLGSKYLAVLAVCALALNTLASDKNPITQPVKVKADVVFIVSLDPATFGETLGVGNGQGTHLGRFVVHTAGSFDFETSEFVGEGIMAAANGDLIYFKMRSLGGVEFTGGTGRFERVTGGYTIELTEPPQESIVDGQLIVTFSYTGQGTITSQRASGVSPRIGSPAARLATKHLPDSSDITESRRWEGRRASR